jgi:hypothetical protein
VKGFGKFRLRHSEALPEHLYTRHASHTRQPSPASPPPPVIAATTFCRTRFCEPGRSTRQREPVVGCGCIRLFTTYSPI